MIILSILLNNKDHKLIAIHEGKYYKRKDGLALGPGCFVKGLEYAAGTKSILIGKPNEYFFKSALMGTQISVEDCVMIGDVSRKYICTYASLTMFLN